MLFELRTLAVTAGVIAYVAMTLNTPVVAASSAAPLVDPEVLTQVASGRVRVLVQLRIPEAADPGTRAEAITRAQDAVLSRVPAVLVRRYQSVPLLALDIDAAGLRALETLGDVVVRVQLDRPVRSQ